MGTEITGQIMAANSVKIKVGDGNLVAKINSDKVDLQAGVGQQSVQIDGKDINVALDVNAGIDFDATTDFDTVIVNANGGKANINTGDGNDQVKIDAKNIGLAMGDGNKTVIIENSNNFVANMGEGNIAADVSSKNVFMQSGDGNINMNVKDAVNTAIIASNGDMNLQISSNNTMILADSGNQNINISNATGYTNVQLDRFGAGANDKDTVIVTGKTGSGYANINTGDGNDTVLAVGGDMDIKMGDGNHTLVVQGNNISGKLGDGDSYIATLEYAVKDGVAKGFEKFLADKTRTERVTELISSSTFTQTVSKNTTSNTTKEIIGQTQDKSQYSTSSSSSAYNVVGWWLTYDTNTTTKTYERTNTYNQVKSTTTETTTTKTRDVTTDNYQVSDNEMYRGAESMNITAGKGNITYQASAKDHDIDFSKTTEGNNIYINNNGGTIMSSKVVDNFSKVSYGDIKTDIQSKIANITTDNVLVNTSDRLVNSQTTLTGRLWIRDMSDPLIFDMNGDGKIGVSSGEFGVDVDGDGKADGAATGGDKMLAMSDLNGNGKVDGAEVFGDKTISPFTGKELGAANGFEALRMLAEEAEKYTGIECIENGEVDLPKLKEALATRGINLGLISDNNVTELEDLGDIYKVKVADYKDYSAEGTANVADGTLGENGEASSNIALVQQESYFTTTDGKKKKVGDAALGT